MDEELFHQLHHVIVIGEGLVELQHGEFRIVGPVDPLVPEVLGDLIYPLEPAYDEPLEVKLIGDAEVHGPVQGIVLGDERPGRRPSVEGLEGRGLHLEEVLPVHEGSNGRNDPGPGPKNLTDMWMNSQVRVALPIPGFHIGKAGVDDLFPRLWVLFRLPEGEGTKGLGQDLPGLDPNRHLSGPSSEERTFHSQPVPKIHEFQNMFEGFFPQDIFPEIELDVTGPVFHMAECALPVTPEALQAASHPDLGSMPILCEGFSLLRFLEELPGGGGQMGSFEAVGKGVDPLLLKEVQLLPPNLHDLV